MRGHNRQKRFYIIIILGILILLGTFMAGGINMLGNKNYIGRKDSIKYREYLQVYPYDKTLAEKGEPIKELPVEVQIGENMYREWLVCYEGMIIVFVYNEERDCVGAEANIQIIGEQYSFGWKKVKVGDERAKIEKIFANSKCFPDRKVHLFDNQGNVVYEKIVFYYNDNYECGMGFSYDEQDKVKTIMVVLGGL